jgi:hypothetical protein
MVLKLIKEEFDRLKIVKKADCQCPEDENNSDDDAMDIDLTRGEEIKDLATIDGKINDRPISVVLDSASNKNLMPKIIADELGLKGNTDVTYSIRGTTGVTKMYESVEATVSLAPDCGIKTTFIVADDYCIPEIILGRATLKQYNYDLFESRDHVVISCNGKEFFIPIVPDKNRQKK